MEKYRSTSAYSVRIRGIELCPGDVLVLDQGATSVANTNFSLQRSYATHCGLVVFLKKDGVTYPAYFEIVERGLRVIPLSSAVAPPFLLYGEVMRPKKLAATDDIQLANWADAFSAEVLKRLPLGYFYDFNEPPIVDGNELGVVCSSLVELFLKRAGAPIAVPTDAIDPLAQHSLATQFKYPLKQYFTPASLLRGGDLAFVGFMDTGRFVENTTREVIIGGPGETSPNSLACLFAHRPFDLAKVKNSPQGAYFGAIRLAAPLAITMGEAKVKAPVDVLALAKTLGEVREMAHAKIVKVVPGILEKSTQSGFSLDEFSHKAEVQTLLLAAMLPVANWFGAPLTAAK